jgi:hypothetical protein
MNLSIFEFSVVLLGSALAGAINTLAGNGSVITLSILTDLLGLPGNLANGTNRVGVVMQSAASSYGFSKNNLFNFQKSKLIILITVIGAIFGVYAAVNISNELFADVFKYLMVLMLVIILVKPERWLSQSDDLHQVSKWISIPIFLALGFYGGFIQMGMGLFYLAVLVLIAKYDMMEANAVKTFVTFLYTILVLIIFQLKGLISWEIGILLAVGQSIGGYYTARYATKHPDINLWAYRLLVVIIISAILTQFGFFKWILS